MGLFSGSRTPPPAPPSAPKRTFTNAPKQWPEVALTPANMEAVQLLLLAAALDDGLKAQGITIAAFLRQYVYEDGILEVPLVVEDGDTTTCVFTYLDGDAKAAAHFSGARAILKERERVDVVFYAFAPIAPVPPAAVLKPIDTPMFAKMPKAPADAQYSLWWSTPEDPSFTTSDDRIQLDRWFEAINGYGYVVFSSFARLLELIEAPKDGKPSLVRMPEQPYLLELVGPAQTPVMLHASAPKGFFLAFDQAQVSPRMRRAFLRLLADFATTFRALAETHHNVATDPGELGLSVWQGIRDEALAQEAAGETGLTLQSIVVSGGQPVRIPQARSAREEAKLPLLPKPDILAFGVDAIDRAAATLQQGRVQRSSTEKLGSPNIDAAIIVRADGRTWHRALPYDDAAEVMAAAARVREDWPTADIVAVLMDAAIRENGTGERVDVLRALVQGRDGIAADTYQRYAVDGSGTFTLVGRPVATPLAAFVPAPTPPPIRPYGQPHAELWAMVATALKFAESVHATGATKADAASTFHDDHARPKMPTALVDRGEAQGTIVTFAMRGPLGSLALCPKMLEKDPQAVGIVFWIDDVLLLDGLPDRRLRFYVQRKDDPAAAIIDQRFTMATDDQPFAFTGKPTFVRWTDSLFV
jgi:hypothetical protein